MDDFQERVLQMLDAILNRLPLPEKMRRVATFVINAQGDIVSMSGSTPPTPIPLVNCANPAAATRALEVIDLIGGTAIPTLAVTSGNAALVALVGAAAIVPAGPNNPNNTWTFGVYPVDTSDETNDLVTVTATLADGSSLSFEYSISGTGETLAIDAASTVGSFVGAPAVPTTPV